MERNEQGGVGLGGLGGAPCPFSLFEKAKTIRVARTVTTLICSDKPYP